ncbi:vancomycin permeability regulator SanA [Lipingzhangella halophila]|uniref:Vancomycin permeability regulator SanA n=1 Tax=Lipingzhangella halophila TaxID=1783352 RepID=A0A7W7RE67_9ACTN|nr:YdcF family protein [Lipingzhangella halophila]MBB4930348.1 vancomycin permeability regulator SanA [Lipingzhangella halophila]
MRTAGEGRGDNRDEGLPEDYAPGTTAETAHPLTRESADLQRTQRFTRSAGDTPNGADGASDAGSADRTRQFSRADYQATADDSDEPPAAPPRSATPPRPRRRRFRKRWIVVLVVLAVALTPVATWGWVWNTARQDERPRSDAIIVLGASQYNGDPSPIFEARLQHAADLYQEGVAPVIITVGGNQPGDNYTEGGAGRDWLVQTGVPTEQIVAIGEGSDTLRSIEAVAGVFNERSWESAVIVSDPWHSLRSRQIARDFGIDAETSPARSGPAVRERETQLWYITRETASLWYYWIFGDSSDIVVHAA